MENDILISYFYNIRYMPSNAIPLSINMSDPKWFHSNKNTGHIFVDNRGVINGLRYAPLVMDSKIKWISPEDYKRKYLKLLKSRYPDGPALLIEELDNIRKYYQKNGFDKPFIVLIVYENPEDEFSERAVLQKWFDEYGYILPEWRKEE